MLLAEPSITRHLRIKSRQFSSMSFRRALRDTSFAVSYDWIAFFAVGTASPSKRGFSLKATRCFFESSYRGFSSYMSSAVIVSKINYSVCKSESPGKRGIPLKISAKMHPIAQTSTVPEYAASPTSNSGALYHRVET